MLGSGNHRNDWNAPGNGVSVRGSTTVEVNEKRRNRKERNAEGGQFQPVM